MGDDIPPTQSHSGWEVLNNDRSSSGVSSDFEGPNPQDEDEVDELDSSRYRQNHASRIGDTNQAIVDALNEAATLHGNTPIKVKRNVDVVAGGSADRPVKRQKTLEGRIVLKSRPSQVAEGSSRPKIQQRASTSSFVAVQDPPTSSDEAEAPQYGVQKKSVLLRTLTEKMPTARKSGFGPPPQKPRHSMPSLPTVHTIDLGNARGSGSVGSSSVTTQSAVNKPSRVGSSSPSSSSDAESNDEPPIVWSKRKARKTTGGLHPKKIFASVMGNANRKNAKSSSSSSSPTTTTSVSRPFAHGPATSASTMQKEAQPQRSQPQSEQPEEPSKVIDVIEISSDSDEPTAPPLPSRTKNKNIIFNSGTISKPFAKPAASISAKPSAFASTSSAPIKTTSTASTSTQSDAIRPRPRLRGKFATQAGEGSASAFKASVASKDKHKGKDRHPDITPATTTATDSNQEWTSFANNICSTADGQAEEGSSSGGDDAYVVGGISTFSGPSRSESRAGRPAGAGRVSSGSKPASRPVSRIGGGFFSTSASTTTATGSMAAPSISTARWGSPSKQSTLDMFAFAKRQPVGREEAMVYTPPGSDADMEDPGVPGGPDNRSFGKALGVSWLDDMSSGAEGRRAGTPVNAVDDDVFVKEQQLSPQLPASDKGKFRASEVTSRPPSTAASCVPSATSISVTGPAKATMDLAEAYNSRAQAHASTSTSTSIPSAGPGATGDGKKRKTKKAKKKRAPPPPVGMTGGGSKDDPLDLTELLESDGDGGVEVMTKASKGKEKHKENEDTGVKKGKGKEESKSSSSSAAASRAGSKTARGKGKGAGEAVNDKERERQKSTFRAAAAALSGMTSTPAPTSVSAFKSVSTAHGTPSSLATTLPIVKGTKPLRYSVSQNSSPVLGERSVVDSETKTEGAAPSTIDTTRPRSASAIRSVDFSRIPFAGIPPLSLDGEVDIEADPDVDLDMHPPTSASASSTRPSSRSSAARMVDARDEENEVDERHIPFSPSSPAPPTITVSGKGKGKERAAPTSPTVDKTTIRGMAPPPPTGSTEVGFDFGEARGDDGSASDDALMEVADMLVSSGSVRSTPGVANITDALGSQDLGEETRRPEGTLEGAKNIVSAVASTSSTSVSSTSTPSTPKTPADDYGGPDFREHVDEEEEFGRREEFSVTTSRTSDKKSYGGYECLTFNDYRQSIKDNPFEVYYARDLPHQLQDFINAMDQEQIRNLPGMTQVFEAFILEHTVLDEPDAPPIKVINEVDHEPTPPWEFQYSNRMWHSDNVPPPDVKNLEGCDCIGGCDPRSKTCKCLKKQMDAIAMVDAAGAEGEEGPVLPMQHEFAYDKAGRLRQPGYPIFECNSLCGCDEDCRNRVVQNGRKVAVSIQKTEHKGWGVFAGPKKIPRGTFLGIYAGEILSEEEGQTRGLVYNKFGRTYLFDLDFYHLQVDEDWDVKYVVDAYQVGNFTRFLNHSCSPNCRIYPCYINEANIDKPLLSVFADRDIEPFEEICFNYNGDQADDLATRAENTQNPASQKRDAIYQRCMCGAENCTGLMFK